MGVSEKSPLAGLCEEGGIGAISFLCDHAQELTLHRTPPKAITPKRIRIALEVPSNQNWTSIGLKRKTPVRKAQPRQTTIRSTICKGGRASVYVVTASLFPASIRS
jgi:hypothetical protein